jgi:glycosyltransferase involved in cell wall biosynthesis
MGNGKARIKVLFLSQRFLYPLDTGGKIRTFRILEQLQRTFRITLISNVEHPKDELYLGEMERVSSKFVPVYWKEPKRYSLRWYWDIFKKSFSRYPIPMLNDYSPELEKAVLNEVRSSNYDLAICDFMQSTLNFRNVNGLPRILFQHNVEAQIFLRHMKRARNPLTKFFWWLQFRKMFHHEKQASARFDAIIAVSENDKQLMEKWYGARHVYVIPTGVETDYYFPRPDIPEKNQIVFVGAMDWLPNYDAMLFFLEDIYPLLQKEAPEVSTIIVGRNPPPKLRRLVQKYPRVYLTGWVQDVRPFVHESAVFIVPIRIGGGTRMKIYQAMAMGKAVVSTRIGAEGLPLQHRKHIYLTDHPEDFARAILTLLRNPVERKRIGQNAHQYVMENFRWEIVARRFAEICYEIVEKFKEESH